MGHNPFVGISLLEAHPHTPHTTPSPHMEQHQEHLGAALETESVRETQREREAERSGDTENKSHRELPKAAVATHTPFFQGNTTHRLLPRLGRALRWQPTPLISRELETKVATATLERIAVATHIPYFLRNTTHRLPPPGPPRFGPTEKTLCGVDFCGEGYLAATQGKLRDP